MYGILTRKYLLPVPAGLEGEFTRLRVGMVSFAEECLGLSLGTPAPKENTGSRRFGGLLTTPKRRTAIYSG